MEGEEVVLKYLPSLEKEYAFWMNGVDELKNEGDTHRRVVKLFDGSILNRYWDDSDTPRPESYKEDVELSHHSKEKPGVLFRHLRAAAESGWDFSSRWFKDAHDFGTIHATEIIPVDLNCLLGHLEKVLSQAFKIKGDITKAMQFAESAEKRAQSIIRYCWNEQQQFFFDYDFVNKKQKDHFTLAGLFPLFFKMASEQQAQGVANVVEEKFLKPGGATTTLVQNGQQWDAPNGWAPLQWITYRGLKNYNHHALAEKIRTAWLHTNDTVFKKTGKMTEKYDVWNNDAEASGGEYPNQDGFGWTNGVYLAMIKND
jgi:alpha,alpha-trehalase